MYLRKALSAIVFLIITILILEIGLQIVFKKTRYIYPMLFNHDIQTDFNIKYDNYFISGNRKLVCNNSSKKEVLFLGDSFVWGQGLNENDNFVNLFSCSSKKKVKNIGNYGANLEQYLKIIKDQNLKNVNEIYLVFYQNDFNIFPNMDFKIKFNENILTYQFYKKIKMTVRNKIFKDQVILINGKVNNMATIVNNNPDVLFNWFNNEEYKEQIIEDFFVKFLSVLNDDIKLNVFLIPEASTLSKKHIKFYKSLGITYLPNFLDESDFSKILRDMSFKFNFKYLDFFSFLKYQNIYSLENIYFDHDLHFNKKGSELVNIFLKQN